MANWKEDLITNRLGGKQEWTDEERIILSHQLDKDLEEKFKNSKKTDFKDQWTEHNWKEQMGQHPIFAPYLQNDDGIAPVSELSEGLAQLKYDPEHCSLQEIAENYKDEGNLFFKVKKYSTAIKSFSEGIRQNCKDELLNAQLYNNRAAAHYFLGNYRSCINDCKLATEIDPSYMKPILRSIDSCFKLENYHDAISCCDKGLLLESSSKILVEKRTMASNLLKQKSRNKRRREKEEKLQHFRENQLLSVIIARCISIRALSGNIISPEDLKLEHLEPTHPQAIESRVHFNEYDDLVWPIVFLYPEYSESDLVLDGNENTCVLDHLTAIFGVGCEKALWDTDGSFAIDHLTAFYEHISNSTTKLIPVDLHLSLRNIFLDKRYVILSGTPSFIILSTKSSFRNSFMQKYSNF